MSSDPTLDKDEPTGDRAGAEVDETPTPAGAPGSSPAGRAAARPRASAPRAGLPARTTPPPETDKAPLDLARRIVELAEDKKAADIILLEIAPLTTVADYLVLCSGGSERQLGAIADGITEGLKAEGFRILSREGAPVSHWILLDAGAVIVHVFAPPERDFYALERLWAEAKTVLRVQ
jgi:ribosome-associated protein